MTGRPIRLRPQAERDQAMKDHVETVHYWSEEDDDFYEPTTPPVIAGWGQDDDEDDDGPGALVGGPWSPS